MVEDFLSKLIPLSNRELIIFLLAIIIALILFIILIRIFSNLKKKVKQIENLDQLIRKIEDLDKSVNWLLKSDEKSFKGLGFKKFTPFGDAVNGYGHSLGILNNKGEGFIITVMTSRESSRVYIREINSGISSSTISPEEESMLNDIWNKVKVERR